MRNLIKYKDIRIYLKVFKKFYFRAFLIKRLCIKKINNMSNFGPKPWTIPFGKILILKLFKNRCFYSPSSLVFYIKHRKSFFHDLFSQSITWEYRGLPGVTGGYKALQQVTWGYGGLQGVTRAYKKLHGVTGSDKGFRGLQRITGVKKGYRR